MSRPAKEILAATTSAGQSSQFFVNDNRQATVFAEPILAGAEVADLQVTTDDGTTWVNTGLQLTASVNILQVEGPGAFRLNKAGTVGATGLYIFETP